MPPRVSVFMPVYNGEPFVGPAVDSVLRQTEYDLELVIVENGSRDGSRQTVRAAAARDSRVRLVEHELPLGLVGAANAGVRAARAPVVARHDQDDLSHPRRLERQLAALEAEPAAVAVGALCDGIDATGRQVRPRDRWRLLGHRVLPPFPHGSLCMKRAAFDRVGAYRSGTHQWEDVDLLLRLVRVGAVLVLPDALYRYRFHARSLTAAAAADDHAALMWEAVERWRRGQEWGDLLTTDRGACPPAASAGQGLRHRDGVRLWSGVPLDGAAVDTTAALRLRRVWQRRSPDSLRAALRVAIRARDLAAAPLLTHEGAVPWQPR